MTKLTRQQKNAVKNLESALQVCADAGIGIYSVCGGGQLSHSLMAIDILDADDVDHDCNGGTMTLIQKSKHVDDHGTLLGQICL